MWNDALGSSTGIDVEVRLDAGRRQKGEMGLDSSAPLWALRHLKYGQSAGRQAAMVPKEDGGRDAGSHQRQDV